MLISIDNEEGENVFVINPDHIGFIKKVINLREEWVLMISMVHNHKVFSMVFVEDHEATEALACIVDAIGNNCLRARIKGAIFYQICDEDDIEQEGEY